MRRGWLLPLGLLIGCRSTAYRVPCRIEQHVAAVASTQAPNVLLPCAATEPVPLEAANLPSLWSLALTHNSTLREAAAEIEIARGGVIQAGKYPNPRINYTNDELGSNDGPAGNSNVTVNQEIVTGFKRKLDRDVAGRRLDAAGVNLLGRKFDVLRRVRRGYYDVLALANTLQVHGQVVEDLQSILKDTRDLVKAGIKSDADVVRLQPLVELARMNQARTEVELRGTWRQLAADVGVPNLPLPATVEPLPTVVPIWPVDLIDERVQAANTDLRVAQIDAERNRIAFERARAEAIPNVTVGGGYVHSTIDRTDGAIVSVETALPFWDRKQGTIHEARARWAQAQAAQRTTADRLRRETAEAFARYDAARLQVEALTTRVLPRLQESEARVRAGYKAGARDITLADVQLAIEAINDARLRLADGKRELWRAVIDLEGLMQLDLDEDQFRANSITKTRKDENTK